MLWQERLRQLPTFSDTSSTVLVGSARLLEAELRGFSKPTYTAAASLFKSGSSPAMKRASSENDESATPRSPIPFETGNAPCTLWLRVLLPSFFGLAGGTVSEPEAIIAGLQDVAMMGKPVEQSGCHFGITEYAGPFAEA
jgi:hypothetical protein